MDPIGLPIQTVLELFATTFADIRFADIDAHTLEHLAIEVRSAADIVAAAELALETARSALQEKQDALLQHAQRALAYARVYAENDEALGARLEAITLPRATRRPRTAVEALVLSAGADREAAPELEARPRPRGRPRNAPIAGPTLTGVTLGCE
ncbi:MAG: hypothetical protein ABTD50_06155 [Polyangiaceae bacterium]